MLTTGKRPLAAELTSDDTTARKWRTCLHEAAHVTAGQLLLKRTVKAIVYEAGAGAAYLGFDDAIPRTFEEALAVAAGSAAEVLVNIHTPPQPTLLSPSPISLSAAYPESTAPLLVQLRQSPSDAVLLAQWCIRNVETQPHRWVSRFNWIHREARIFVARHQQEIVDVATELFNNGIVTLEAPTETSTAAPVEHRISLPAQPVSLQEPMGDW